MSRIARTLGAGLLLGALGCSDDSADTTPTDPVGEPQPSEQNESPETPSEQPEAVSFEVRITNTSPGESVLASGVFNTPEGADEPGPVAGSGAYTFDFYAAPGNRLSFATMFVQSNDLFYAPSPEGIELFDQDGEPVLGDITDQVLLWDAGTEVDEPLGTGAAQAPRQDGPDSGDADPDTTVRLAEETYDSLPAVADVLQVTLSRADSGMFTLRIDNISAGGELGVDGPLPIAPGVWAVHSAGARMFEEGGDVNGAGLEALAEDGNPGGLMEELNAALSLTTPLAPGVWAVHPGSDMPLFSDETADRGEGLEPLAEDGDPMPLAGALEALNLQSGVFAVPSDGSEPAPALPGASYAFTVEAVPGDRLSFATMVVQSNDLFLAPLADGLELFDEGGAPRSGDITQMVYVWDAGTEVNELPGIGASQAPRQKAPDTGDTEGGLVRMVDDADHLTAGTLVTVELTVL